MDGNTFSNALIIPVTRRTARQGTVRNDIFGYNERSELTSAELGSAPYAYDYDNIGNRKTAQEDAEAVTYESNELNQYTDITTGESSFIPEYDGDGKSPDGCKGDWTNREARLPRRGEPPMGRRRINQTRIKTSTGIWTASYNAQNRPTRFTRENADGTRTVITAAYDYLGRRAWKKVETIATDPETGEETATITLHQRYIYRGYLQVAACDLTRGGHPCLWLITWDPTQPTATRPLAIQKDGTWYCYGWDLTKNVCEVYGQAGYIRTTYSYTPYGSVTGEGDVAQPLQWSSEYADPELGLVYYNYRSYNPRDGRWIRRDPVGIKGGLNLYKFVSNTPIQEIDLLGLGEKIIYSSMTVACSCGMSVTLTISMNIGLSGGLRWFGNASLLGNVSLSIPCDLSKTSLKAKPGMPMGRRELRLKATITWDDHEIQNYGMSPAGVPVSWTSSYQDNYKITLEPDVVSDTSENCCPLVRE